MMKKLEKQLDRSIFERAIAVMKEYGVESILSQKIFLKRNQIRKSLLNYYEKTEEYEKCFFVKKFFDELESKFLENISPN